MYVVKIDAVSDGFLRLYQPVCAAGESQRRCRVHGEQHGRKYDSCEHVRNDHRRHLSISGIRRWSG